MRERGERELKSGAHEWKFGNKGRTDGVWEGLKGGKGNKNDMIIISKIKIYKHYISFQ